MSAPSWCRAGYVLPRSSEVVVIDGLGQTLRMGLSVMRAMNPEVGAVVPPPRGSALRVKIAERVITQAESLLCALAEYRLAAEREEQHGAPLADDDIPFSIPSTPWPTDDTARWPSSEAPRHLAQRWPSRP